MTVAQKKTISGIHHLASVVTCSLTHAHTHTHTHTVFAVGTTNARHKRWQQQQEQDQNKLNRSGRKKGKGGRRAQENKRPTYRFLLCKIAVGKALPLLVSDDYRPDLMEVRETIQENVRETVVDAKHESICVWCVCMVVHISGIWRRTLLRNDLRSSVHTLITHPSTPIYLTLTNTHMFTDTMLFPYFLGDNLISVFLCFCASVFSVFQCITLLPFSSGATRARRRRPRGRGGVGCVPGAEH